MTAKRNKHIKKAKSAGLWIFGVVASFFIGGLTTYLVCSAKENYTINGILLNEKDSGLAGHFLLIENSDMQESDSEGRFSLEYETSKFQVRWLCPSCSKTETVWISVYDSSSTFKCKQAIQLNLAALNKNASPYIINLGSDKCQTHEN